MGCGKDDDQQIIINDPFTSVDWGKPEIIINPSGYYVFTACPESHRFTEDGMYYFDNGCPSMYDWSCSWEWIEPNKKLRLNSATIIPYNTIIEILEVNGSVLHTREWKGEPDSTSGYWELKYYPN